MLLALVGATVNIAVTQVLYRSTGQARSVDEIPIGAWFLAGVMGGMLVRRFVQSPTARAGVRTAMLISVACLTIGAWIPFDTQLAPAMQLVLVDSTGALVSGARASEIWRHYGFEPSDHTDERESGPEGIVAFPRRVARASLARRVRTPLLFFVMPILMIHQSVEPTAYVIVYAHGLGATLTSPRGGTTRVVMH